VIGRGGKGRSKIKREAESAGGDCAGNESAAKLQAEVESQSESQRQERKQETHGSATRPGKLGAAKRPPKSNGGRTSF